MRRKKNEEEEEEEANGFKQIDQYFQQVHLFIFKIFLPKIKNK